MPELGTVLCNDSTLVVTPIGKALAISNGSGIKTTEVGAGDSSTTDVVTRTTRESSRGRRRSWYVTTDRQLADSTQRKPAPESDAVAVSQLIPRRHNLPLCIVGRGGEHRPDASGLMHNAELCSALLKFDVVQRRGIAQIFEV